MRCCKGELLSVVIPVHNGEQYIQKTVRRILKQTYQNIEIILVENNSKDNSWEIVQELARLFPRVKAVQSNVPGTSLARRKGVEEAAGRYIVFSDQDDRYYSRQSLSKMVTAIESDGSQICQFNYFVRYRFGLQRKKKRVKTDCKLSREQLMQTQIGGVLGTQQDSMFNATVWNKIYDAQMLKDAVKNIDVPLFFAEDIYLNFWAFTNSKTRAVSARTDGIYVWSTGIGFSSRSRATDALFRDYEYIKPTMLPILEEIGVDKRVIWNNHVETLYFLKAYVRSAVNHNIPEKDVLNQLSVILSYRHVQNAQKYILDNLELKPWGALIFMAETHDENEFYKFVTSQ